MVSAIVLAAAAAASSSLAQDRAREEWSNVMGWISVACWLIPSFSQVVENYQQKSGEGLSLAFVVIWLAGDLLNMIGAIRQELLWTMIILAAYYSVCDVILIVQYWYYQKYYVNGVKIAPQSNGTLSEASPLLRGQAGASDSNINASSISRAHAQEAPSSYKKEVLKYVAALSLVVFTGIAAWQLSKYNARKEIPGNNPQPPKAGPGWKWDAQISGWLSAALYLASRVPQIFKNRITKCEGLSLALFLFAVAGNITYVASIIIKSTERQYLVENASWLVGSGGTIFLDFIVLGQFLQYKPDREAMRRAAWEAEQERATGF